MDDRGGEGARGERGMRARGVREGNEGHRGERGLRAPGVREG